MVNLTNRANLARQAVRQSVRTSCSWSMRGQTHATDLVWVKWSQHRITASSTNVGQTQEQKCQLPSSRQAGDLSLISFLSFTSFLAWSVISRACRPTILSLTIDVCGIIGFNCRMRDKVSKTPFRCTGYSVVARDDLLGSVSNHGELNTYVDFIVLC